MSLELKQYIREALTSGASLEEVVDTLTGAGWAEPVVRKTLEQFAGVDSRQVPIPAPRMQAHQLARDLFVYILILMTLTSTALALGHLLFDLINQSFHENRYGYGDASLGSMALLIVTFPVFSLLSLFVQKDIAQFPQKRESIIRKLLIYTILAVTVIITLSDLTLVLHGFLKGDLSTPFLLRSAVVIGIALLIFANYFVEMKQDDAIIRRKGLQK